MLKILIFFLLIFEIKAKCPKDAFEWQTSCFFFVNISDGFADAESNCADLYTGHLSSVHDGFTNALLAQKGQKYFHESAVADFWIGLTNLIFPGNWTWTDGTTLDFNEWIPGEPQNATLNCAVLTITNGKWGIDDCFKSKPYVCKVDKSVFETTTLKVTTTTSKYPVYYANCTVGFFYFEPTHSCYGTFYDTNDLDKPYNVSWTQGEQICINHGGHLASIHSNEELKFLESFTIAEAFTWTGSFSNDGGKTWKWSDNSLWDFVPWGPGNPTSESSSCGLLATNGLFNKPCDQLFATTCKIPIQ
uniref:C-type lectin domain-containing protein n=1 Tax=Panagrolaimus sp. ES5 TaxID=591445 RepID=A0AC34F532_9BILA